MPWTLEIESKRHVQSYNILVVKDKFVAHKPLLLHCSVPCLVTETRGFPYSLHHIRLVERLQQMAHKQQTAKAIQPKYEIFKHRSTS